MEALTLLAAAFGVTTATDMVRNAFDKANTAPKWTWNLVSLIFAIAVPFFFNVEAADVPGGLRFGVTGAWLQVWTGLAIWGLSKFGHEFMDRLSPKAHA